jgi:hypothetical protein
MIRDILRPISWCVGWYRRKCELFHMWDFSFAIMTQLLLVQHMSLLRHALLVGNLNSISMRLLE